MIAGGPFDLVRWLSEVFPELSLGGHLYDQWTIALRFEIGVGRVARAEEIFNAVFGRSTELVLLSEDSDWEGDPVRWYELFSLPGLLHTPTMLNVQSHEVMRSEDEEDLFTLRWATVRPSNIRSRTLFEAIANQDLGGTPSVRGQVYIIDPCAGVLLWMYDDRGMEVLASRQESLLSLRDTFATWVLDQRFDSGTGKREFRDR